MTSEELAKRIWDLATLAIARVTGTGKEQYELGENTQIFETLSLSELQTWLEEELADVVAYSTMAVIRAERVFDLMKHQLEETKKRSAENAELEVLKDHYQAALARLTAVEDALYAELDVDTD